jgi:endonuclease/exonuclease/phosphatase family metal-dependent hydrolase
MSDSINKKNRNEDKPDSSITRKSFLKSSALSLVALTPLGRLGLNFNKENLNLTPNDNNGTLLRTIEYNIFNGAIGYKGFNDTKPFPDKDEYQLVSAAREMGQIPRRMALQLELYKPDIISFCESATEDTIKKMAKWLNMNYAYFPGAKNGKGHYPGSILTHYEIVHSENRPFVDKVDNAEKLFTRHWGKAEIRLSNGEIITVHSAHTWPFTKNGGKEIRLAEIEELLKSIHYDLSHHTKSVILQGDMNLTPDSEGYKKLIGGGLTDAFTKVEQGIKYTATSKDPHVRIDYIFAAGPIADKLAKYRPLYEGAFRINADDPKSFALSDHIPSLADFEL